MASETPPPDPVASEFPQVEDYQFEPMEELSPSNEFVDAVLTRAGELALDLIEGVQEHPVLTASLLAAGGGAIVGLVASALAPRRRPAALPAVTATTESPGGIRLTRRLADASGRVGGAAATAGQRVSESGLFQDGLIHRFGRPARDAAAQVAAAVPTPGQGHGSLGGGLKRAQYMGQLVPIALTLLRNPIVRDLIAQVVAGRLRRSARM